MFSKKRFAFLAAIGAALFFWRKKKRPGDEAAG